MQRMLWGILWALIRGGVKLLPLLLLGLLLHFYLPGHDVVRIVGTDVKRMDTASRELLRDSGTSSAGGATRDVRFINAVDPEGAPRVYRNEETGWGFPWYFKFDSGNLQTIAQDLTSTAERPKWVVVTHYGWRIELLSMFPNVVDIAPAAGPDDRPLPWFNILFLVLLAALAGTLWYLWRRFLVLTWRPFLRELELDERFENGSNVLQQLWRWSKASLSDGLERLRGRPGARRF